MDAVTANVVWLVIWFILIWGLPSIGFLLGSIIAVALENLDWSPVFVLLGWLVGGGFAIFAVVQTILHIISLVQLLAT